MLHHHPTVWLKRFNFAISVRNIRVQKKAFIITIAALKAEFDEFLFFTICRCNVLNVCAHTAACKVY